MKKAIAIDGNSMFYRMYYATMKQVEYAIQNNWTPNNAIRLMINQILKFINNGEYDYYFVAFDAGSKTFRHKNLESYKQNRQKTPDELISQMQDCKIALEALGINVLAREGIEADDLVGSFAKIMNDKGVFVDIFTSDKDLLQIVNPLCNVNLMKTGLSVLDIYSEENFREKFFDLTPNQVIDYKSIIGDSSDCLPGVSGVGPKTGVELIKKYGTLSNIYDNLHELSDSQKLKFETSKEIAFQCLELAEILKDQFDDVNIDEFILKEENESILISVIKKYKLKDLNNYIQSKKEN
ncbi:MAG: 5'-3' exonuclease [Mycoplasma sp.]